MTIEIIEDGTTVEILEEGSSITIEVTEESIEISDVGPQGPPGSQGLLGPIGPQGPIGLTGATGATGATGSQGPAGPQGIQGIQGVKGDTGDVGPQGTQGPQGIPGEDGTDGLNGIDGADGLNGWSPAVAITNDGARRVLQVVDWIGGTGTKPATGYIGATGIVALIADAVDIRGPAGVDGINGTNGTNGQGVPTGGSTAQILMKNSSTDFDTVWSDTKSTALTAAAFIPSGSTVPTNGFYLSAANTLAWATNSGNKMTMGATGDIILGTTSMASSITVNTNLNGGLSLNSSSASGPAFNLNQTTNTWWQFFSNGGSFGVWNNTLGITTFAISGGTAGTVSTVSGGRIGFSSSASNARGGMDTAISRVSAGVFAFGNGITAGDTTAELRAGNFKAMQAGKGFFIKEGTNAKMGQATLVGGTILVNNTSVNVNSRIELTRVTPGGTQGHLSYSKVDGVSFTINSTEASETSLINWVIWEAA